MKRVFIIRYNNQTGTCFTVFENSNEYIITARHIFPNTIAHKQSVRIEVMQNGEWFGLDGFLLLHTKENVDIAVIDMSDSLEEKDYKEIGSGKFFLTEECYFLGYPFGLVIGLKNEVNTGSPRPFIKKGIISAASFTENEKILYIDGHNNPGFSGGQLIALNYESDSEAKWRILGVVSAYIIDHKLIDAPYGQLINKENSGIVVSYSYMNVYEIINRQQNEMPFKS